MIIKNNRYCYLKNFSDSKYRIFFGLAYCSSIIDYLGPKSVSFINNGRIEIADWEISVTFGELWQGALHG